MKRFSWQYVLMMVIVLAVVVWVGIQVDSILDSAVDSAYQSGLVSSVKHFPSSESRIFALELENMVLRSRLAAIEDELYTEKVVLIEDNTDRMFDSVVILDGIAVPYDYRRAYAFTGLPSLYLKDGRWIALEAIPGETVFLMTHSSYETDDVYLAYYVCESNSSHCVVDVTVLPVVVGTKSSNET